jgi:hypothetical protein
VLAQIFIYYIGLMFEWCYQGADYDEAVRRHYANLSKAGKTQIEAASKELAEDL